MVIYYIYALIDPDTHLTRYIGATRYKDQRKYGHKIEKSNAEKREWYERLSLEGKEPVFTILKECTEEEWRDCEAQYIKEAKDQGLELLNKVPGGRSKTKRTLGREVTLKIYLSVEDYNYLSSHKEATGVSIQFSITKAIAESILNMKAQQAIEDADISFEYTGDEE